MPPLWLLQDTPFSHASERRFDGSGSLNRGHWSAATGELRKVGTGMQSREHVKPEPAVPLRRSIASDHLVCLMCGKKQEAGAPRGTDLFS
jgi:hypothetical protein